MFVCFVFITCIMEVQVVKTTLGLPLLTYFLEVAGEPVAAEKCYSATFETDFIENLVF